MLLPLLLLLSTLNFSLQPRPFGGTSSYRVIGVITGSGPARGGGAGLRAAAPAARPKPPAPKPAEAKTAARKTGPLETRKVKADPRQKIAETVDTRLSTPAPVPVPSDRDSRGNPAAPSEETATPATDPIAEAGPLLAGVGPVAGSEASIGGVDGVYFPYNYYLELIRGKVADAWSVPEGLVARGRRIESVIRFRIMRDGSVAESAVEVPSGQTVYDQAALRAVSLVRRFPPLPQEFGGEFLVVHFQFAFVGR